MNEPTAAARSVDRLLELMARLRAPDGCAWDRAQTPATLKPQLLEECYEVLEAVDGGSPVHLAEELGDVLLHLVFQAQIAQEKGDFTFADVANGIADKLVRRHPHVFGDGNLTDAAAVVAQWQELKKLEKPERASVLDGVPLSLPALMRAEALQTKARQVGFDWPDIRGALDKVREEMAEVTDQLESGPIPSSADAAKLTTTPETAEEIGDLLFSVVNLTRHLQLNAEELLSRANHKFSRRFRAVEERVEARGKRLADCSLSELDREWDLVKMLENDA